MIRTKIRPLKNEIDVNPNLLCCYGGKLSDIDIVLIAIYHSLMASVGVPVKHPVYNSILDYSFKEYTRNEK